MAKEKVKFVCKECGNESAKWSGKCFSCGEWNTLEEETYFKGNAKKGNEALISRSGNSKAQYLYEIEQQHFAGFSSGMEELDRTLGGKIVHGSLTLIGGDPGKGKSTLLLQASGHIAKHVGKVLYVSGEESEFQVKLRAERLGIDSDRLMLLHSKDIDTIERVVTEEKPVFLVVDSIQTVGDTSVSSEPGSPAQVKTCINRLMHLAKGEGIPTFTVGHVTKDNVIAGPKMLEHMVDTVLYLEGEKYHDLRLVRSQKNRFGSDTELGIFRMDGNGLVEVPNPSDYLLSNRNTKASGSAVVAISDTRPLLIEVQALVATPTAENTTPRRTSEGFSRNQLNIILAVLEKKCRVRIGFKDVFLNVVSRMEIEEPGADLGVAMALYSSEKNIPIDPDIILIGEIGLTGEVRAVTNIEQLLKEAAKVGFTRAVVPKQNMERLSELAPSLGITIQAVDSVATAISLLFPS